MDYHPTPFPGNKAQSVKSKYKKMTETPKQKAKEATFQRQQRRTFGTIRNPNVPAKTVPEKPKPKPTVPISQKQTKSTEAKSESESAPVSVTVSDSEKKSPENIASNNKARPKKKKSVSFPKNNGESPAREAEGVETPVRPPFSAKPIKIPSGTPYVSAEKCSNCRFDRLETSSYWLGQIKSAESVGKHFVSVTFFRLAIECKAEPIRNLRTELKRYLVRHSYLSSEMEWNEVCCRYGISKDNKETVDASHEKAATSSNVKLRDDRKQMNNEEEDPVKEIYKHEISTQTNI